MTTWTRQPDGTHHINRLGKTYALWKHAHRPDDKGRVRGSGWYLHTVLPDGTLDQEATTASLGSRIDEAKRLAVLELEGWTRYYTDPQRGELWRCGPLVRPLSELLAGAHRATAAAE